MLVGEDHFTDLENSHRINYWKKLLMESDKIAMYFSELIQSKDTARQIRPFEDIFHCTKH